MDPKVFEKHEIEALKEGAIAITFSKRLFKVIKWTMGASVAIKGGWLAIRWITEALK